MTRRIDNLHRVVARTVSVGKAGDWTATKVAASIERESVSARLDREEREFEAAQLKRIAATPFIPADGPTLVAIMGGITRGGR